MKIYAKLLKLKAIVITLIILIAVFTGWNVNQANAQERRGDGGDNRVTSAIFGQFGITTGQTARLNVVNAHPGQFNPNDPMYPPDPVKPAIVELKIINRAGEVIARKIKRLAPGKSVSLQINGEVFSDVAPRVDLRALVTFLRPNGRFHAKLIIPTLEVINNDTGVSSIFMHPARIVGFDPQPEPPA